MEKDMRQVLNYPFWYSEDRIPVEACEQIIEMGKNLDIEEAGIYTPDSKDKGMDATYRKTNVAWFPDAHPVEQIIQSYVSLANIETGWNFTITNKEPVQFGEYKTRYFYNWHRDVTNTPGTVNRKLSVSVNLSNPKDYEGGNLQIKSYWGTEVLETPIDLRLQGTVIVFPSALTHRISHVKRGTRYSLVQWYSGPEFT